MEQLRRISGTLDEQGKGSLLGPAFAHTPVGLSIADLEGKFVESNAAFLTIVGRSFDELAGETVASLTHPEDRRTTEEGIASLVAGDISHFSQEKRYLRPDGAAVWVRNSVSLLRDETGTPRYTLAITENVDVRRRAEEAVHGARETLEIATAAGGVGIWDVDMVTGGMEYSPICRDIFGLPYDVPLTLDDFYARLHPEDRDRLRGIIKRVADPLVREVYDAQYRIIQPSGEVRWGHATGRAYFAAGPNGAETCVRFIGAIRDITEQRRAVDALIQAEKLAATGRLAASIAHEINNPLESVTNLLFLLREAKDETDRRAYLGMAEEEIRRVTEIATQTLRFYRDPSGPTACELATLLDSVLTMFHGRLNLLTVSVVRKYAPQCVVRGSQGELRQVLVNLVSNGLDAMNVGGGRLWLRLRHGHHVRSGAAGVWLTVADSGEGMSRETIASVFQPFFTTKKTTGTGLGLWLSLEILNKHGATIRLRSRVGKGTLFLIFLPM